MFSSLLHLNFGRILAKFKSNQTVSSLLSGTVYAISMRNSIDFSMFSRKIPWLPMKPALANAIFALKVSASAFLIQTWTCIGSWGICYVSLVAFTPIPTETYSLQGKCTFCLIFSRFLITLKFPFPSCLEANCTSDDPRLDSWIEKILSSAVQLVICFPLKSILLSRSGCLRISRMIQILCDSNRKVLRFMVSLLQKESNIFGKNKPKQNFSSFNAYSSYPQTLSTIISLSPCNGNNWKFMCNQSHQQMVL